MVERSKRGQQRGGDNYKHCRIPPIAECRIPPIAEYPDNRDDDPGESSALLFTTFDEALVKKEKGNFCFREGKYSEAVDIYQDAWGDFEEIMVMGEMQFDKMRQMTMTYRQLQPVVDTSLKQKCEKELTKVIGNMAECELRLKNWGKAIACGEVALEFDPNNKKALYRIAKAYFHLGKYITGMAYAERITSSNALQQHQQNNQKPTYESCQVTAPGEKLYETMRRKLNEVIKKHKSIFQLIIDSYRLLRLIFLSSDDNATYTTHATHATQATEFFDAYSCVRSQHPGDQKHRNDTDDDDDDEDEYDSDRYFRAYLRMGIDKRVIRDNVCPERNTLSYQALIFMSEDTEWSDTLLPPDMDWNDFEDHFHRDFNGHGKNGNGNSVWKLIAFTESIIGIPVIINSTNNKEALACIAGYMSDEEIKKKKVVPAYRERFGVF